MTSTHFNGVLTLAETDSYADGNGFNDNARSGYSGPRPRLMHISIGSIHILSVSVSGSINEPLNGNIRKKYGDFNERTYY